MFLPGWSGAQILLEQGGRAGPFLLAKSLCLLDPLAVFLLLVLEQEAAVGRKNKDHILIMHGGMKKSNAIKYALLLTSFVLCAIFC